MMKKNRVEGILDPRSFTVKLAVIASLVTIMLLVIYSIWGEGNFKQPSSLNTSDAQLNQSIDNKPLAVDGNSKAEQEWRDGIERSYGDKNKLPEVIKDSYDFPEDESAANTTNLATNN